MRKLQVTLSGADSAHHDQLFKPKSRVWVFPDGIHRVITMSVWQWKAHEEFNPTEDDWMFAEFCYNNTVDDVGRDHPNFEFALQEHIKNFSQSRWRKKRSEVAANDYCDLDKVETTLIRSEFNLCAQDIPSARPTFTKPKH